MSDEVLVRYCAPTLAGLKTGTIFNTRLSPSDDGASLQRLNHLLSRKGLRLLPVSLHKDRLILYLYRVRDLERDLRNKDTACALRALGYPAEDHVRCVAYLLKRLRTADTYPHEIGFFLGFPAADVIHYMKDPADKAVIIGPWKVFTDAETARQKFRQLKKCTDIYCEHIRRGTRLERLIV